jgi:hypothetical protein
MWEAEGIRNLVADGLLCPEKAVETHLFSNNLDVPLPASCRNKDMEFFGTRIARALIVVSRPNEKDGFPSPPKLTHTGIAQDQCAPFLHAAPVHLHDAERLAVQRRAGELPPTTNLQPC